MVEVHEVEVGLSTNDALKDGVVVAELRKVLVAADHPDEAVRIAIDMAWRGDVVVTHAHYVL
jgi:hypothetical protein